MSRSNGVVVHDYSFSVFSERKKEMGVLIRGGRGVSHKRTSFIDFRSAFFLGCVRGGCDFRLS